VRRSRERVTLLSGCRRQQQRTHARGLLVIAAPHRDRKVLQRRYPPVDIELDHVTRHGLAHANAGELVCDPLDVRLRLRDDSP
jgi:hypothetical protein